MMMNKQNSDTAEKYDRESTTRTDFVKPMALAISVLAVSLSLFHLYTSYAGSLVDIKQRSIHLYTLMTLGFLLYPFVRKRGSQERPGL